MVGLPITARHRFNKGLKTSCFSLKMAHNVWTSEQSKLSLTQGRGSVAFMQRHPMALELLRRDPLYPLQTKHISILVLGTSMQENFNAGKVSMDSLPKGLHGQCKTVKVIFAGADFSLVSECEISAELCLIFQTRGTGIGTKDRLKSALRQFQAS